MALTDEQTQKHGFELNKKSAGQFLTQGDPFAYDAVRNWLEKAITCTTPPTICEPYAGTNNLLKFLDLHCGDLLDGATYHSFDIEPCNMSDNAFPLSPVVYANTLLDIPLDDIDIIITNPPYLARNSARRQKLDFPFDYDGQGIARPSDLYQISLDTCLRKAKWVAAIIPESFITSQYDKSRLMYVISLPGDLFHDTDMPVCLALFGSEASDDYEIYNANGALLSTYSQMCDKNRELLPFPQRRDIKFNRKDGQIGLHGLDNTKESSIRFCDKEEIDESRIKVSSRGLTRIFVPELDTFAPDKIAEIIEQSNTILNEWREATSDIFLTAFKGVRADGKYRRRLSYDIANQILVKVLKEFEDN